MSASSDTMGSMRLPIFQVDAFADRVFAGNPAAVCPLETWLDDATLQGIAAENNLSETAFLVEDGEAWKLRWFTPVAEVELCGHATLASAWVIFEKLRSSTTEVVFRTRWAGELRVVRCGDLLEMDLPARPRPGRGWRPRASRPLWASPLPRSGTRPKTCSWCLASEAEVRSLRPDIVALGCVEARGVIVTARGEHFDFVSRYFAPRFGIPEDPVTGSAHCVLAPYWAVELGRLELRAAQVSPRGGELLCRVQGDRVKVAGCAALYLEGMIEV